MVTEKRERHATDRPGHSVRAIIALLHFPDSWLHLHSVVIHSPLQLWFGAKEYFIKHVSPLLKASLCMGFVLPILIILGSFTARSAVGQIQPIQWEGNEHYYLVVNQTTNWDEARLLAESMVFMGIQGHLATITSEGENTFVTTQLGNTAGAWLGGEQLPDGPDYQEPTGGWRWITDEPWEYTKWDTNEPNNTYGGGWGSAIGTSEERLHYHHNGNRWNDLPGDPGVVTPRFIVEWDAPTDNDADSIPDEDDNCPTVANSDQSDSDGDGSGDVCDVCPADPFNDGDGDGVCGDVDNCPLVPNTDQADADSDGVGDGCNDADDPDGDDFATARDNCPALFNPNQTDGDEDGFGDVCDVCPVNMENDADGDGLCESNDNCPLTANANQFDADQDGVGDACDSDDDNDSILDATDNCPLDYNPTQADTDEDGAGNVCDTDDDNDGVLDAHDQCLFTAAGATVNADGCAIADLCPCANNWKNHGAYVSCVANTAEDFVAAGLLTAAQKDATVAAAAQSNCGSKK